MLQGYSFQFQCPAVIIESQDRGQLEEVIFFAREIGALYYNGDGEHLVVDYQTDQRRVGPEVYTERALRADRFLRGTN